MRKAKKKQNIFLNIEYNPIIYIWFGKMGSVRNNVEAMCAWLRHGTDTSIFPSLESYFSKYVRESCSPDSWAKVGSTNCDFPGRRLTVSYICREDRVLIKVHSAKYNF